MSYSSPRFLNADLDIEAHTDLHPLMAHWRDQLCSLVQPADTGTHFVRFELLEQHTNAADTIRKFCEVVENLPTELLGFWRQCPVRSLDIGYDSGDHKPVLLENLPAALLARVAQYFTALNITIYPLYLPEAIVP